MFKTQKIVYLADGQSKWVEVPLRLVIYESKETGQDIYFISNILNGYKIPKLKFFNELLKEYVKIIIKQSGEDPNLSPKLRE